MGLLDNIFDKDKDRLMLFCDFYKGKPDAYRGVMVKKGSKLPEYIEGLRARKDKPIASMAKVLSSLSSSLAVNLTCRMARALFAASRNVGGGLRIRQFSAAAEDAAASAIARARNVLITASFIASGARPSSGSPRASRCRATPRRP